uniref:Coiled-coil domain-containing protein 80 n=1 Tax=Electrophorus electricus TaxID=8005 RepID=A0A4W4GQ87_ELEEL
TRERLFTFFGRVGINVKYLRQSSVGARLRNTRSHAESQSKTLAGGYAPNIAQSKDKAAVISGSSSSQGTLQVDQAMDSAVSPARRVLTGRRPVAARKPSNVPAPDASPLWPRAPISSTRVSNSTNSISVLAGFTGRNRVLVISAPGESDGYYKLMLSLLKPSVYCELAERHVQLLLMFHGQPGARATVRRIGALGNATDELLEPALVPRLTRFLHLEEGKFSMVLLRKTLQVEERYPYPVRLEAVYEMMDHTPMRRLEKARQKGFVERCRAAGIEGRVAQPVGPALHVRLATQGGEGQEGAGHVLDPTRGSTMQSTITASTRVTTRETTTSTTTTRPATTAAAVTTRLTVAPVSSGRSPASHSAPVTPLEHSYSQTASPKHKASISYTYQPTMQSRQRVSVVTQPHVTTSFITQHRVRQKEWKISPGSSPPQTRRWRPVKDKLPKGKNTGREPIEEHGEEYEGGKPTVKEPEKNLKTTKDHKEPEENLMSAKAGKASPGKAERRKKMEKPEKNAKKKAEPSVRNRNMARKGTGFNGVTVRPMEKSTVPKKSLEIFWSYFEKKRRRLLVITSPSEHDAMYAHQRNECLAQVCDMALRKISIISIFGPLANSTVKIDHYQMEQDQPVQVLSTSELINQELITAFRKELGMLSNDFYMVLTDFNMKVKQEYEVPIMMKAVFDYIDTFSSRLREMELQRKLEIACKKEDKSRPLENFLSRFRWRRRLLVISTPDRDDWAYQQQLHALSSHACNLGVRHMSVVKLVGRTEEDMIGVLELYPINGSAGMEREDLTSSLVRDIRNYFQVSVEYFSMLLVGKDGNVKSWYPSPVWSMAIIYDLIDTMQLRKQEMAIQLSLGMGCPENDYDQHNGHHDGYGY